MPAKKRKQSDERIGLKLSVEERTLILGGPVLIQERLAEFIRATATGDPVPLTLDDLEDLGVYVAAAADHTTDVKIRKRGQLLEDRGLTGHSCRRRAIT